MKPIRITPDLLQFAKSFYKEIFKKKRDDFVTQYDNINSELELNTSAEEISVLKMLKKYLAQIQLLLPEEQEALIMSIENHFGANMFYVGKSATPFSKKLVSILRYERIQNYGAAQIAEKLNLKVCPYCNAALAITVPKNTKRRKARFQLDHYFPKSKYPYLSTCFFNLIPSCGNCNQTKSNGTVSLETDFHLFAQFTPENAFKFKLDNADIIKAAIGFKKEDIKLDFVANDIDYETYVNNHNESYDIKGIYDTQKDIVEELIWKSQAYSKLKMDDLAKLLKIDSVNVKRMVVGNYTEYEDIHKRPMAKFMQDIAEQLDLI